MSNKQISGSGEGDPALPGVVNQPMLAVGVRATHDFYPSMPPLIILPNGAPAITATYALKPVYSMLGGPSLAQWAGQHLHRIDLASLPNGLLLTQNPNYLSRYPGLIFPGKDDKSKDPRKLRARISFTHLQAIAEWRLKTLWP